MVCFAVYSVQKVVSSNNKCHIISINLSVSLYIPKASKPCLPTLRNVSKFSGFFLRKKYKGVLYSESLTNFGVILAALYFPLRRNFPTGTMGLKPDKAPHKQLKKSCQQTLPRTPDLRQVRIWNINS